MGILGRFAVALMPEQTPFPVLRLVDVLNRPRHMAEVDIEDEDDEQKGPCHTWLRLCPLGQNLERKVVANYY